MLIFDFRLGTGWTIVRVIGTDWSAVIAVPFCGCLFQPLPFLVVRQAASLFFIDRLASCPRFFSYAARPTLARASGRHRHRK